ncbi:hypothetical protein [Streptomyces phaeochromogenes]|uniref:hypothetical protein n=1 Tax=Streptomyces phaeochromogenes TaxID=1923 RepID=UPI002DD8A990|nr:hypothetical protein [Streptomyces phaeochromogenes]
MAEGRAALVFALADGFGLPVAEGVADALGVPVVVVVLTWSVATGVAAACPASALRSGSDPRTT